MKGKFSGIICCFKTHKVAIPSHNKLFQSSIADVTKVYKDLRLFVFRIARTILLRGAVPDVANAEDAVLRSAELSALKTALRDPAAYREIGSIDFGESFRKLADLIGLPSPVLNSIKQRYAKFMARLAQELVERIPLCIEATEKLRFFAPKCTLARVARPTFRQLPLDLVPAGFDIEVLERQWAAVGELTLTDVCPEEVAENKEVETIKFWGNVWDMKNGAGKQPYKELAEYVLALLSLPLSNAVVERLFSLLAVVENKQRNCLSVPMLEAILRIREHLRASRKCCKTFQPTAAMVSNFNSAVMDVQEKRRRAASGEAETDAAGEQALDDPDVVEAGEVNEEELIYTLELIGGIDVQEEIVF
ncbi:SCAN domain-containing protein 3 [Frankliniella fusca]|uniref:SCAN domain-containing protein 3 n=1 Tax=Frankliniella fusca TaxID=407009 RepID=A0AAE1HF66_9NEOP|nr:SCAN domain-containing protein 3 [Frankliniella fusca]